MHPVRFDDRLTTVLVHPASSPHERAVRWRQLVELVARAPADGDRELVLKAVEAIRADRDSVDERVRSATALAAALVPLPVELVCAFGEDRLSVAAPVLSSARLTAPEWKQVSSAASEECRAFIAAMRHDPPAEERPSEATAIPSIGEVVARIERLRHMRDEAQSPSSALNRKDAPRLFRWECNDTGEIDWVEGVPRGALVGHSIAHGGKPLGVDRIVERAFESRSPFHDRLLELPSDMAAGGKWKISGIPAFDRSSGRFSGYRGIAERGLDRAEAAPSVTSADPNTLRELAHEIRTPLNAIIGFAEIISGEYLGPAEGRFRDRAGDIVAQARLLVEAVDDLDFAARARSAPQASGSVRSIEMLESLAPELRDLFTAKGAKLEIDPPGEDYDVPIDPELARRLVLRLAGAVADAAFEGETLRLWCEPSGNQCRVTISRPAALKRLSESELFGASEGAGGAGFSLRLIRGLANLAGADLSVAPDCIALEFRRG